MTDQERAELEALRALERLVRRQRPISGFPPNTPRFDAALDDIDAAITIQPDVQVDPEQR